VARFLADENFPFPVVEALRRMGHDVVTVADAGKAGQGLHDLLETRQAESSVLDCQLVVAAMPTENPPARQRRPTCALTRRYPTRGRGST